MEHRTVRPVIAGSVEAEIEATIAGYMASGLRERLVSAGVCKCFDCGAQLRTFNAWCMAFTDAPSQRDNLEGAESEGEWFNDYSDNPNGYRFRRAK